MSDIEHLANLITGASASVVFTGAGMSTESGLSDFRSPGGIWSRHQPVYYDEFISSREARARYWKMRRELHQELSASRPNAGHYALARFEELGKLIGVVTQNIDGLHQEAGSRNVVELHGTSRVVACIRCGKEWPPEEVDAMLEAGDDAPDCDECGAPLKSKTISFGQPMPHEEMARATELSVGSDVYLAIGSSLVVEPAASMPRLAKQNGATLVIINNTDTPLDGMADLIVNDPIGATLRAVWEIIDPEAAKQCPA
jgi:NAD-dependent deacetylase